jgi:hypothetical protein
MEFNKKNTVFSAILTSMILLLLYFSGPGLAIKVTMQQIADAYLGQAVTINGSIEINSYEIVPIQNAKLIITGPQGTRFEFPLPLPQNNGSVSGSYSYTYGYVYGYGATPGLIINITAVAVPMWNWMYGYGYAFDEYFGYVYGGAYAYAYNWNDYQYHAYSWCSETCRRGYGGYGYIYGTGLTCQYFTSVNISGYYLGGGSTQLFYTLTWPTSWNYPNGTYTAQVVLVTNQVNITSNPQNFNLMRPKVLINEIMPNPGDVDWDGNGSVDEYGDEWIELYNTESETVDITGWTLEDSNEQYTIDSGTVTMGAHSFKVFFGSETGIRLPNTGDTVILRDPNGIIVDQFTYSSTGDDQSWRRTTDGGPNWEKSSDDKGPSPQGSNVPINYSIVLPMIGWNLISFPLTPLNKTVLGALSSIIGNFTAVVEYTTNPGWRSYVVGEPVNPLRNMSEKKGYWIYINASSILTITGYDLSGERINLVADWNLVGYPSTSVQLINESLATVENYTLVQYWNTTGGNWLTYVSGQPVNILNNFTPGRGYWLQVPVADQWVVP